MTGGSLGLSHRSDSIQGTECIANVYIIFLLEFKGFLGQKLNICNNKLEETCNLQKNCNIVDLET